MANHLKQDDMTLLARWAFYEALKSQFSINLPDQRVLAEMYWFKDPLIQ